MKMKTSPFINYKFYYVQRSEPFDLCNDASQYAPIPGSFNRSSVSPSNISRTNIDPDSPIDIVDDDDVEFIYPDLSQLKRGYNYFLNTFCLMINIVIFESA